MKKPLQKKVESENDVDDVIMSTTFKPATAAATTTTATKSKENVETVEIDPAFKLMQEALNTTNQYLAEAEALMSKPVNVVKRTDANVVNKPKVDKPLSNNSSVM